jgi:uncharacterized repeat protein (TIGR01451 family)
MIQRALYPLCLALITFAILIATIVHWQHSQAQGLPVNAASADLQIRKWASATEVASGDSLLYTIVVRNLGPATAQALVIRDLLPPGIRYRGIFHVEILNGSSGSFDFIGGRMSASFATLDAGGFITITLHTQVSDHSAEQLINTAGVTATNDLLLVNNLTTATVWRRSAPVATNTPPPTVQPRVPISTPLLFTKRAHPNPARLDEPLLYTIVVTNHSPVSATQVIIRDELPTAVRLTGTSTILVENGLGQALTLGRRALTGTVQSLQPQGIITMVVRVQVLDTLATADLVNIANLTATSGSNLIHHTVRITTAVVDEAPVSTPTPAAIFLPVVTHHQD